MLISAVHLWCICWIYCIIFVLLLFYSFVLFCCLFTCLFLLHNETIHKSFGKLLNSSPKLEGREKRDVCVCLVLCDCACACVQMCEAAPRVRVCVCACLSNGVIGGNIDFKDIEEDKYSLSITTVQEVVFKAVLVQTFCRICFHFLFFFSEECCSVCKCIIF